MNNLWIVAVVLGLGAFSMIGWLWGGFLAGLAATIASGPPIGTAILGVVWLGGSIHAGLLAPTVLRQRVLYTDRVAATTRFSWEFKPARLVPPRPAKLDVNAATESELALLPSLETSSVAAVLEARRSKGGFRDFADFAACTGLRPDQLAELRPTLEFGPVAPPEWPGSDPGRILNV